jgi:M3 family oligoendopeptidase
LYSIRLYIEHFFTLTNLYKTMAFENFDYTRPEINAYKATFETVLSRFEAAQTFAAQNEAFAEIVSLRAEFESMNTICQIRHTINTADTFYASENDYYDEVSPDFQALVTAFYKALLGAKFRTELEAKWGKQLFVMAELSQKTFEPTIMNDLQTENRLSSEYTKLNASASIVFEEKTYNLSGLTPIETGNDRARRKAASTAKWGWFEQNSADYDRVFDELVKTRHNIAVELGYKNFVELGYTRMLRSDYTAADVARYREQVRQYIVPIATQLRERQRARLDYDKLYFYDEGFSFASGNAKPQGSPDWIVNHARTMYNELSPETNEFFGFMLKNNLMDLENKENKAPGGYCTMIANHKSPFIYSNFNGTSHDIDVLTHEAGHAFQVYQSRDLGISEYHFPTYEACEIHSMSMEFLTWPWMNLFFEGDTDKYKFEHLAGSILFLPYGVAVDEFQHWVYENHTATPDERKAAWREIEKKYLPHRNYENNAYLEAGGFWQKQSHIYQSPFYYIDYTLAQICAFQFWKRSRENRELAWSDYLRLCKAGGSQSFLELVKLANLRSPFEAGCLESVVDVIQEYLDSVDDKAF